MKNKRNAKTPFQKLRYPKLKPLLGSWLHGSKVSPFVVHVPVASALTLPRKIITKQASQASCSPRKVHPVFTMQGIAEHHAGPPHPGLEL